MLSGGKRSWQPGRHGVLVAGLLCLTGALTAASDPGVPGGFAVDVAPVRLVENATPESDRGDARKPAAGKDSSGDAQPPRNPQPYEMPRREDTIEIGSGAEDPVAFRTLLA